MEESSRRPRLVVSILTRVARWSVWLLLAICLMGISAWGALHWLIVPRIGELRPTLESRASQALGIRVTIGELQADAALWAPTFTLADVRLFDAQGRVALSLPKVLATVSPTSLWNLGFDRLYIERPQLDIRRNTAGRLFIAGLEIDAGPEAHSQTSDWLFSQTELVIRSGRMQWTDELRGRPTLDLSQVDLLLRNQWRHHELLLDATPPPELGARFGLRASFNQQLLSRHAGERALWDGQVYAGFERVDIAQLRRYAPLGLEASGGTGAMRAWIDVRNGKAASATADVALSQVSMVLGEQRTPVLMNAMSGRLGGRLFDGGFEFFTEDLRFDTQDGLHWPGGRFRVTHQQLTEEAQSWGEVTGERLNLDALVQLAKRLPLDARFHDALTEFAPKGTLEQIQLHWRGPLQSVTGFDAKGRVAQLQVRAASGLPGVAGLNLGFDFNQSGGRADVMVSDGHIELPGWFEDPVIELAQLSADLQWQVRGEDISVQSSRVRLRNADAQGEAQFKWRTADGSGDSRFPGVLDLQGTLSRAEGARIYRYLPLLIGQPVRDYVRDAVTAGQASSVKFRLSGNLKDMPFDDPRLGEFRISANLANADFAYVPRSLQEGAALPWPALTQLSGMLVFERAGLQLRGVSARLAAAPALVISQGDARIADLAHAPTVQVGLEMRGPLADLLKTVMNGSPLAGMTNRALVQASAAGQVQGQLQLKLPLDALDKSTLLGQLRLFGNDLQISPELPRLSSARGVLHFNERGFAVSGLQARALGGDLQAEGGMIAVPGVRSPQPPTLRIQGSLSAEGLRQASELGAIASLGQKAMGRTTYNGVINWSRGASEMLFTSNLQGLTLDLPAPFNKASSDRMPLRLATELTPETLQAGAKGPLRDRLTLTLGSALSVRYLRDVTTERIRVLRGAIAIGPAAAEPLTVPEEGVNARLQLANLNLDLWRALFAPPSVNATANEETSGYAPSMFSVQAENLTAGSHRFNQFVAGGTRVGQTWQLSVDARELSGYVEYREAGGGREGRVYGRLARMLLAQSEAREVETLLVEQPVSIPTLDIVIEDMELLGKKFGRVEIDAVNRGGPDRDVAAREWRLNKLNVIMPEASFSATGNWAGSSRRKTTLNFTLDMSDAGELLARMGTRDVFRSGKGKMEGQVRWFGSPLALDYPSLSGAFHLNVENGQFLKAEPGIAKLLGVLSLQSLPRRLTLDFRDVFSDGFAFDFVRGDVQIEQGVATTNNLQMKGVNAAVLMEGRADIAHETQDLKVVVVPEINAGTASLIAGVINPAVGLGTFLAQLILRRPLIESTTQEFSITGSWADPKIVRSGAAGGAGDGNKSVAP